MGRGTLDARWRAGWNGERRWKECESHNIERKRCWLGTVIKYGCSYDITRDLGNQ